MDVGAFLSDWMKVVRKQGHRVYFILAVKNASGINV